MSALSELEAMYDELVQTSVGYTHMRQPLLAGTHWSNAMKHYKAAHDLLSAPAPGPQPVPGPTPTPPGDPIFFDDFHGPAGSSPDPTKWWVSDGEMGDLLYISPTKAKNVFLDGNGRCILRAAKEPYLGKQFSGAFMGTFHYGTGWPVPAQYVLAAWPVPFRYEARMKMPANAPALWTIFGWLQNVDRPNTENIYEVDAGEMRMTYPSVYGMNQHTWLKGADIKPDNYGLSAADSSAADHVLACEVRTDSVKCFLDGVQFPHTSYGVSGKLGLLLQNIVAAPGSWGAGGASPTGTFPCDLSMDYVAVYPLT